MMGAVESITRGLAVDLAPIRVNAISPGYVKTEVSGSSGGVKSQVTRVVLALGQYPSGPTRENDERRR